MKRYCSILSQKKILEKPWGAKQHCSSRSRAPCFPELLLRGLLLHGKCRPIRTSPNPSQIVHLELCVSYLLLSYGTRKLSRWLYCETSGVSRSEPLLPTDTPYDLEVLTMCRIHWVPTVCQTQWPFPGRILISILYRSKMRPKRLNDLPSQRGRQWESQNAELGSHTPKSSLSSWESPNKPWYLTYKMGRDGNLCRVRDQTSSQPHESLSLIIMEKWPSNDFLLNIVQGVWKTDILWRVSHREVSILNFFCGKHTTITYEHVEGSKMVCLCVWHGAVVGSIRCSVGSTTFVICLQVSECITTDLPPSGCSTWSKINCVWSLGEVTICSNVCYLAWMNKHNTI